MKIIDFSIDANEIEIVPLADWHLGSAESDFELIKETCDYIKNTPNCYCILNGDLVDHITTTGRSPGSVFEATMTPKEQVITATYLLQDICKMKKVISFTIGNHEARQTGDGLSPADLLLAKLMNYDETLNERYSVEGAYIFLTLNARQKANGSKATFTIFHQHGAGGGSRIGAKISRLDSMSEIVSADVFIRSHTHQVETHKGIYFAVNTNQKTVKEQPCLFVSTGSALKWGGYGAKAGMKPLSRAIPLIKLKADTREHHKKQWVEKRADCIILDHLGD